MEEELKIRGIDAKDRNQVDLEGLDYLIAQLPQDEVFLSILTFYLIDPKSVQSFFNKDPLFKRTIRQNRNALQQIFSQKRLLADINRC